MIKMNQSLEIRSKGFIRIYIILLLERGILSKLITIQTSFYEIQPGALLHPLMKYFPILKQIGNGSGNLLCQATRYTQHRVKPSFEVDGSLINCDLFIILRKIMQLSHSLLKNFLSKKKVLRIRMTITLLNDSNCRYVSCIHMSQKQFVLLSLLKWMK